jgi:hypothetical protein
MKIFKLHDFVVSDIYHNISESLRFYSNQLELITTSSLSDRREITARVKVPPGSYLIIPCTDTEGKNRRFILRVFTEKPSTSW